MSRIVQKYGGTSVGDVERIKNVAERIKAARDEGHEVVVVLSARAGVTNELIARAKGLCPNPSERELDQLLAIGEQESIALMAMALHGISVPAVSYTGRPGRHLHRQGPHQGEDQDGRTPKPIEKDLNGRPGRHRRRLPGHRRGRARSRPSAAAAPT